MPPHDTHARRPRLERRPEATSFAVDDLLAAVGDGKIRVPGFQRGMRWGQGEKAALLDSIFRGYPVGTLLFWKRPAPRSVVELGGVTITAPERADALWVVDGQQRVATLVEATLRSPTAGEPSLCFDLVDETFVWERRAQGGARGASTRLVPTTVLLDTARLMEWLLDHREALTPQGRALALDVGKRLREFRLPGYVVETDDEGVLRVIFERINRTGARMTDAEVFHALYVSAEEPKGLAGVSAAVASTGWGAVSEDVALRTLLAIEGLPLDRPLPNDLDPARMDLAVRRTERALAATATFLRERGAIPHEALNPYALPLIVLGRFFDAFPSPSARSVTLLRRWLWRGLCGLHLAGAITDLRQHLRAIVYDEHESVQRLLGLAPAAPAEAIYDLGAVSFRTARTRLQCCALASLEPRDLRDGGPCDVGALSEDAEGSPLVRLTASGDASLALRLLHPAMPPTELLARIQACDDRAVLDSHAIPYDARDALRGGDLATFEALRAQALRKCMRDFFERQAEWGADDSPPLSALASPDEDEEDGTPGAPRPLSGAA